MSEISQRPNLHIGNAIQQLLDVEETASSAQILNIAIAWCKRKITTVARRGGGGFGNAMTLRANMAGYKSKANGMISAGKCGQEYMPIWLRKCNAYDQECVRAFWRS